MKRVILIFVTMAMAVTAVCQQRGSRSDGLLQLIADTATSVRTLKCDFRSTKHISLLKDEIVSTGTMAFATPDRFRWEYLSPSSYLFVVNGTHVYAGNDRRKDVISTSSNRTMRAIVNALMGTVTGRAIGSEKDFNVAISEMEDGITAVLTPLRKETKQIFTKVVLTFDSDTKTVSRIEIHEKNGDTTDIVLSNVKINTSVDDSLFAVP